MSNIENWCNYAEQFQIESRNERVGMLIALGVVVFVASVILPITGGWPLLVPVVFGGLSLYVGFEHRQYIMAKQIHDAQSDNAAR